ncbi:MAG: hypothetical protein K6T78_01840 [Alicyclobacillus sp.]|nr:hypothetical protein [Alicyclobacillus sp.]
MVAIPAMAVVVITAWFAVSVTRQWVRKRRLNLGFWSISLWLSCVGSAAYCLAAWHAPGAQGWFLVYYGCGALWMPCLMGLGSLALVCRPHIVWILAAVVLSIGALATVELSVAPVHLEMLRQLNGGAGTGIIAERTGWLAPLIGLNSFGALAVVGVAVVSAIRTAQKRSSMPFLAGNLWIAGGVLVISAAGSAARLGWPELFWVLMAVGWAGFFVGYHLLTPKPVSAVVVAPNRSF